jgi:cobalt-precorrin-5B (C1)-methyltransferase
MGGKARKALRSGFTTGTAAAAAAKAALVGLLDDTAPGTVTVAFLSQGRAVVPVRRFSLLDPGRAEATVIKDAGDDPDVTHGAEIGAVVAFAPAGEGREPERRVVIRGGRGVGRVTKPGLEVPPGEAAINPGPREMITREATAVLAERNLSGTVTVEVFVPEGEALSRNTLNARLGILGGISILGTTGIVRPMSHEAYEATIRSQLAVARAVGLTTVVFTTGRRSERYAMGRFPGLPEEGFIQIGDFFRASLEMAAAAGVPEVLLAVFFGKAVKMAVGVPHTHAAKSDLSLAALSRWAAEAGVGATLRDEIAASNTARHAFDLVSGRHPEVIHAVGRRMLASARGFAGKGVSVRGVVFDYEGRVCFDGLGEDGSKIKDQGSKGKSEGKWMMDNGER